MSYAIGYIAFGILLEQSSYYDRTKDRPWDAFSSKISELAEADLITRHYSGNGDPTPYIGADMIEIDECNNDPDLSGWSLVPTEAHREAFRAKLDAVLEELDPEEDADFINALTAAEPKVFLTWGSS